MKHTVIVHATRFGQTSKIAGRIVEVLAVVVPKVEVLRTADPIPEEADGFVVGGPVYAGKLPSELLAWAKKNAGTLNQRPCGLFTVSLNAADQREAARKTD